MVVRPLLFTKLSLFNKSSVDKEWNMKKGTWCLFIKSSVSLNWGSLNRVLDVCTYVLSVNSPFFNCKCNCILHTLKSNLLIFPQSIKCSFLALNLGTQDDRIKKRPALSNLSFEIFVIVYHTFLYNYKFIQNNIFEKWKLDHQQGI